MSGRNRPKQDAAPALADVSGLPTIDDEFKAIKKVYFKRVLVSHPDKGGDPAVRRVIDPYGARNEAEFFAVATEAFFERPESLRNALPALYALLADFYRQDPAARASRGD